MKKKRVESPLYEVRRWKEEISKETTRMTTDEVIKYFHEGAEKLWKDHGYKCIQVGEKTCIHARK